MEMVSLRYSTESTDITSIAWLKTTKTIRKCWFCAMTKKNINCKNFISDLFLIYFKSKIHSKKLVLLFWFQVYNLHSVANEYFSCDTSVYTLHRQIQVQNTVPSLFHSHVCELFRDSHWNNFRKVSNI